MMIVPKKVAGKYAEFNRVTALPAANGLMGDGATTPVTQSSYVRTGRNLKVLRRKGAVTVFLQDASRDYIDVTAQEMENFLTAHVFDMNMLNVFGSEAANAYSWTGLDSLIGSLTLSGTVPNRVNQVAGGAVPTNLKFLDDMLDYNTRKQGARHRKAWIMSPEMVSLVSRILTNVRLVQNQRSDGLQSIEINGGWRLQTYRNVPIIESRLTRPQFTFSAAPTNTAKTGSSSGLGGATTLYFVMSYIGWDGESIASAELSTAITTEDTFTLTFTEQTGAAFYKIYCTNTAGGGTGAEKLVAIIPAKLYTTDGTPNDAVVSVQFTTNPAVRNPTIAQMNGVAVGAATTNGGVVPSITASVPFCMAGDVPLTVGGNNSQPMEIVVLWDLDEIQGMGRFAYTNTEGSRFKGLATMEPLAKTDDNLPFLVKTYGTLIDGFEQTSFMNRGLRVA